MAGIFDQPHTDTAGLLEIAKKLYKGFGNNPRNKETVDALLGVTGVTPGVGDVQSGIMAAQDVKKGNYGSAALNSLGLLPFIPALGGITAWHGSPFKFDKFDSSKIGSGVGNQLFGRGMYFAESPDVAKQYSGKLSSELSYNGKPMMRDSAKNTKDSAAWALYLADGDKELAKSSGLANPDLIEKLNPNKLQPGGQLYKVDIPDESIPKMIDYDRPLSEQPQFIQNIALQNAKPMVKKLKEFQTNPLNKDLNLNTIYDLSGNDLIKALGGTGKAENILQNYGVTGVKYAESPSLSLNKSGKKVLDKTGAGTSNYVVYDPSIVKILERNGLLLP